MELVWTWSVSGVLMELAWTWSLLMDYWWSRNWSCNCHSDPKEISYPCSAIGQQPIKKGEDGFPQEQTDSVIFLFLTDNSRNITQTTKCCQKENVTVMPCYCLSSLIVLLTANTLHTPFFTQSVKHWASYAGLYSPLCRAVLHPCHFGFGWHCVCVYIVFVSLQHPSVEKHLMWSSFCSQWQIMNRSFVLFVWQVTYAWLVSTAQQVAQMEPTALQARTWTPQVHGRKATAWHARRANTVMAMATICPQGPVMLAITVLQEWMCHHLPSTHVLKVGGGDVLMLVWVLFVS